MARQICFTQREKYDVGHSIISGQTNSGSITIQMYYFEETHAPYTFGCHLTP